LPPLKWLEIIGGMAPPARFLAPTGRVRERRGMDEGKMHKFDFQSFHPPWMVSAKCGIEVYHIDATKVDAKVTCKNCLRVMKREANMISGADS